MTTDLEFTKQADVFLHKVLATLEELDPDEVDCDLAGGVLVMEFADGTKCILNRQTAAHQIWLAEGALAWHFAVDPETSVWTDTKGRGPLVTILAGVLGRRLGRPIALSADS